MTTPRASSDASSAVTQTFAVPEGSLDMRLGGFKDDNKE